MANIVHNHLNVSGPADALNRLMEFIGDDLSFSKIAPMPPDIAAIYQRKAEATQKICREIANNTPNVSAEEWQKHLREGMIVISPAGEVHHPDSDTEYEKVSGWISENWGADYALDLMITLTQVRGLITKVSAEYYFETKWSFARQAMFKLSALFPDLVFDLSWNGEFPEMSKVYGIHVIAGDMRNECEQCIKLNKPVDACAFETFASYLWGFCEEHKTAWCVGKNCWTVGEYDQDIGEFYRRFGRLTLAELAHSYIVNSRGEYSVVYSANNALQWTLVHMLEETVPAIAAAADAEAHFGLLREEPLPFGDDATDDPFPF